MFGSKHTIDETIKKIEAAAMDVSLSVERMNNSKVQYAYTLIIHHPNPPPPKKEEKKKKNPAQLNDFSLWCTTSGEDAYQTEND